MFSEKSVKWLLCLKILSMLKKDFSNKTFFLFSSFQFKTISKLVLLMVLFFNIAYSQTPEPLLKVGKANLKLTGLYSSKNTFTKNSKVEDGDDLFPEKFPLNKKLCREDIIKRTYTSRTFIAADGQVVIQNSLKRINYKDSENNFQVLSEKLKPIDNGWGAERQEFPGYLTKSGSTEIKMGAQRISFNRNCKINSNDLNLNDYTVGENGMYAKNVAASIDKKIVFNENRIETDYIINHPVQLNGADLIISEEIILPENCRIVKDKEPNAIVPDADEYIVYTADNKKMVRFHTPLFYDAARHFTTGKYVLKEENGVFVLQVIVPNQWLTSAERVFPVTIDPLVTGPDTMYPPLYMGSCELPNFNSDSILITIPADITITAFIVTDSYFADETQPGVTMNDGHIYLTTPCAATPVYSVGGSIGDTAGYAYLDSADLKPILACCFAPSCNVQTFYLAHYLARTNWTAPGCTYSLTPPFNYIYYSPISPWPFNAFIVGHTVETTQPQWVVYPSPICSDSCHIKLRVTTNYGVPPYTITHPWFAGSDNYGVWGSCASTGKDTIDLTIPGCPTYCVTTSPLSVPPPVIVDACGIAVAGLTSKNITVNPVPDAAAVNITLCTGTPINIPLTSCVGTASFAWSGSNGTSGSSSPITDNVTNSGNTPIVITYTVTPTATGCSGTPVNVTATVTPVPVAAIASSNGTDICTGQSVTLTASGGTTYQWSGGSTANTAAITVSPLATTTYSVTAVTGSCSDMESITITVSNIPTSTRDTQYVCIGKSLTLTAFPAATYQWTGGITSTSQSVTVSPTVATYYYETGTSSCGTFYDTILVIVNPIPTINIINNDTTMQAGNSVQLYASGGATYMWSYGSLSCYLCPNPMATPTISTTYTLTGTDTNNCVSTDNVTIVVMNGTNELYIPNSFSPNGDGINDFFLTYGIGIKKIEMKIFNKWGELIYETDDKTKGWDGKYELDWVPQDVYVYKIYCEFEDGNERKSIGKVTVVK